MYSNCIVYIDVTLVNFRYALGILQRLLWSGSDSAPSLL